MPPALLARLLSLYGTIRVSPVPKVNYAAVGQLARIGALLNQIARRLHSRDEPGEGDLRSLLAENLSLVQQLREELINPRPSGSRT
jgi:hypothetical protein